MVYGWSGARWDSEYRAAANSTPAAPRARPAVVRIIVVMVGLLEGGSLRARKLQRPPEGGAKRWLRAA
jgi:hypothetical protein